ncbi:hypothetical protein CVIRNUC_006398 [Coccomyxa viridis]|uniref:Uncharacterized protein n=1 Tax=Coccomyxa viridis TaxID=1274662 RepID=A0AAV1IB94_9CHLO|nr:hypothetical protein CVIRNUC_006398 [Coccomyxa viridis]
MCALASPEQLTLWRVMFEPSKAACRHQEASRESMSSMSQMTSIRQMLQQSTLEDLQQTCDPKRRFMHALATAALQQTRVSLQNDSIESCSLRASKLAGAQHLPAVETQQDGPG